METETPDTAITSNSSRPVNLAGLRPDLLYRLRGMPLDRLHRLDVGGTGVGEAGGDHPKIRNGQEDGSQGTQELAAQTRSRATLRTLVRARLTWRMPSGRLGMPFPDRQVDRACWQEHAVEPDNHPIRLPRQPCRTSSTRTTSGWRSRLSNSRPTTTGCWRLNSSRTAPRSSKAPPTNGWLTCGVFRRASTRHCPRNC